MKITSKCMVSVAVFSLACVVAGCGSDAAEAEGKPTGSVCDESLTYETDGQPFINKYCIRCHTTLATGATRNDAPVDVNFDDLSMIQIWAADIDEQSAAGPDAVNTVMPEAGEQPQPTEDERRTLGAWLACGPNK